MVVTVTHAGYVKRVPQVEIYRPVKRGGKGAGRFSKRTTCRESLLRCFPPMITCYQLLVRLKVHELPLLVTEPLPVSAIINVIESLAEGEKVAAAAITTREFPEDNHLTFFQAGYIGLYTQCLYDRTRKDGLIAPTPRRRRVEQRPPRPPR